MTASLIAQLPNAATSWWKAIARTKRSAQRTNRTPESRRRYRVEVHFRATPREEKLARLATVVPAAAY